MTNFLKLLGILACAVAITFFNAWCFSLIYASVVPLFAKFAITLPELTYGMFVLIELVITFLIASFRRKTEAPKKDYITMFADIFTHELVLLIYAACAVWASSIIF